MNRVAMGATLAIALSLAMLALLFLLFNLFCSLLCDKRREHNLPRFSNNEAAAAAGARPLAFPSFYAHGVLKAPTEYLLSVPNLEAAAAKQASPDHFVYISNPIYDGSTATGGGGGDGDGGTPFVTSTASPLCFEPEEGNDDCSPPLKLMKKLPAVLPNASPAAAACLFDGRRSLRASTETNRQSSSSSSNSLCSSPSW